MKHWTHTRTTSLKYSVIYIYTQCEFLLKYKCTARVMCAHAYVQHFQVSNPMSATASLKEDYDTLVRGSKDNFIIAELPCWTWGEGCTERGRLWFIQQYTCTVTYCLHDILQFVTPNLIFSINHIKSCSTHDNTYFNLHVTLHINLYQAGMFWTDVWRYIPVSQIQSGHKRKTILASSNSRYSHYSSPRVSATVSVSLPVFCSPHLPKTTRRDSSSASSNP